ncbi:MAG: hypothetical protein ACT4P3_08125 [Betaproteobacteria bacterium]
MNMRLGARGRVAKWSREQIDRLTTPELRALLENAERLKEDEVAALCADILDARPHGRPPARYKRAGPARMLVSRNKAFAAHVAPPANRVWSCGAARADGSVLLLLAADKAHKADGAESYLLWAPDAEGSHPWSESPAGRERLQHCRAALERGGAGGLRL